MVGINVNVDGGQSGSASGESSKYLKEMAFIMKKSAALGRAGLGGGIGGILSLLSSGGAVAAIAGIVAAVATFGKSREPGDFGYSAPEGEAFSYKEIYVEGEKQIAKINDETQQIVDLLSIEEARQQEILDEKDNVLGSLKTNNDVWVTITGDMERYKGSVNLTAKEAATIEAYSTEIGKSLEDIDKENAKWYKELAGENGIVLSMEEAAETSRKINTKLKSYLNSIPTSYSGSGSGVDNIENSSPITITRDLNKGQGTIVPPQDTPQFRTITEDEMSGIKWGDN